jgi:hypothetical protein
MKWPQVAIVAYMAFDIGGTLVGAISGFQPSIYSGSTVVASLIVNGGLAWVLYYGDFWG